MNERDDIGMSTLDFKALVNIFILVSCFLIVAVSSIRQNDHISLLVVSVIVIALDLRMYRTYKRNRVLNRLLRGESVPIKDFNEILDDYMNK